jgi:site-specific recombinase XerD
LTGDIPESVWVIMKLLEKIREVGMRRHLSPLTIECYQRWAKAFLVFCRVEEQWRKPGEVGAAQVQAFLAHLAVDRQLSASTQNQAFNAIG